MKKIVLTVVVMVAGCLYASAQTPAKAATPRNGEGKVQGLRNAGTSSEEVTKTKDFGTAERPQPTTRMSAVGTANRPQPATNKANGPAVITTAPAPGTNKTAPKE